MKEQGGGGATDPAGWERMNSPGVSGGVVPTISCGSTASVKKSGTSPSAPPSGFTWTNRLVSSVFMQLKK